MKGVLRIIAAVVLLSAILFWAAAGSNRGWTKTSVPRKIEDPVTGIEGVTYEKKFIPGLDFLGVAAGCSAFLAGVSLFPFRKKTGV